MGAGRLFGWRVRTPAGWYETAFGTPQQTASGRLSIARPLLDLPATLHLRPAGFSARFGPPTPLPPGFADPGKFSVQSTISTDSLALFRVKNLAMVVAFRRRQ